MVAGRRFFRTVAPYFCATLPKNAHYEGPEYGKSMLPPSEWECFRSQNQCKYLWLGLRLHASVEFFSRVWGRALRASLLWFLGRKFQVLSCYSSSDVWRPRSKKRTMKNEKCNSLFLHQQYQPLPIVELKQILPCNTCNYTQKFASFRRLNKKCLLQSLFPDVL